MNQNEEELKPFMESSIEISDPKIIEMLLQLGYKLPDIELSLNKRRFDEIFAAYQLIQNGGVRKSSRSKAESASSISSVSAATTATIPSPSAAASITSAHKSETITNGEGLKETSFMTKKEDLTTAATKITNEPPSPEIAPNNFKRQHTIGPESLKERNAAIRLNIVSGTSRPISATPKVTTERGLQKSPIKPLRAFKPEALLSTTAQTPRRPNVNVYKKVDNVKDTAILAQTSNATANSSSSSSSTPFARNGPARFTFHSTGPSRLAPREHSTLGSKVDPPTFPGAKGNFLQRLTTRFSKRFRLSQTTKTATVEAANNGTKN